MTRLSGKLTGTERKKLRPYIEVLNKPGGRRVSWCWAAETPDRVLEAFAKAERFRRGEPPLFSPAANRFLSGGRWQSTAVDGPGNGAQGSPVVLTWSLVPDGTLVTGTSGSPDGASDLRTWLAGIYGGNATGPPEEQPWFPVFEEAFSAMGATCGLEFRYQSGDDGAVMDAAAPGVVGLRGDIRIGARFLDGNSGLLGISLSPNEGDMVLDSGDGTFDLIGGNSLRLFNTLTHELGHCLGLAHVCPIDQSKLMEPNLSTAFRGPQFDEVQSLQRLYGDPLERYGEMTDNDSAASATPLTIPLDGDLVLPRLSIDDNGDEDFFALEVLNGQRLQVELAPGEGSYLEGAETGNGCFAGEVFDSAIIHDLRVEIRDRDGEGILLAQDGLGPGGVEDTGFFEIPRNGRYFVRVSGGEVNAAQIYQLSLRLEDRAPGPRLVLGESEVMAESGVVKNGRPDPNETIRVRIPVVNEGLSGTESMNLSVTGSDTVTVFSATAPGTLSPDETGFAEIVFGAAGVCGDNAELTVTVSDDLGVLVSGTFPYDLGEVLSPLPLAENFDGGAALPLDWESQETGGAEAWRAASSRSDTPLRSAFVAGLASPGESFLLSPAVLLAASGGTLSFRHLYRTEFGFDGGVLEVSRDGGPWVDAFTGWGLEVTGGYDRVIRENFDSPIAGRLAWTGRLNEFQTTSVVLPPSWAGEEVRFRWRFASDRSGTSEGWWVDTVRLVMEVNTCEAHRPVLTLRLDEGGLDENYPTRQAVLVLESELPLLEKVALSFDVGGTAGAGDYSGDLPVLFPAGQQSLAIPLGVVVDQLNEGAETLAFNLTSGQSGFASGNDEPLVLEITDRTTLAEWSSNRFEIPVDLAGDQDGDGLSGLGEYLLGSDPTDAGSRVLLRPLLREDGIWLPTGHRPERDDAVLGIETSNDLLEWEAVDFVAHDDGLLVPSGAGGLFLRLTFAQVPEGSF